MAALIIGAFVLLFLILSNIKSINFYQIKWEISLFALIFLDFILITLKSNNYAAEKLYGTAGRNTGFLTYMSLLIFLGAALLISSKGWIFRFNTQTLIVSGLLAIYGLFQSVGKEIFPYKSVYENKIIGTFGNPDFQSAFLGIMAVIILTLTLGKDISVFKKIIYIAQALLSLLIAYRTNALQGLLSFIAGIGIVFFLLFLSLRRWKVVATLMALGGVLISLTGLALFNLGPLSSYLYKGSVSARGYYWDAGLEMLRSHMFIGVGLDNYGDWFLRSRSLEAFKFNSFLTADAAHNVYIDLAASGGLPLILLYLCIMILVLRSILLLVKRSEAPDIPFLGLCGGWAAYQVQAFVSINQIGIAIWGWVLSGLIIGYEINTREPVKSKKSIKQWKLHIWAPIVAGITVGGLIGLPPYIASGKFYNSFKSSDVRVILSGAKAAPLDRGRLIQTARLFESRGFHLQAINLVRISTSTFPDSTEAWQQMFGFTSSTQTEKALAKIELRRLDPLNPLYK
jgi:O-antigen ligase